MDRKYKVVIIGFSHMHINDVAAHFYENPRTELVAAADTHPVVPELNPDGMFARNWNKAFCEQKFHIPRIYDDYVEMLDAEKPDLAVVTCENALHPEVVENCAKRGIDCNIEKPMAMSLSDGLKMARSARTYGTSLIINWPISFYPHIHMFKRMYDEGRIGKLIEFKCRVGSPGPLGAGSKHPGVETRGTGLTEEEKVRTWWHQNALGGGAMVDFCSYGCLLGYWLNAAPAISAMGLRGNFTTQLGNAEDEAAMLVRFPESMAIIEGTWTTPNHVGPDGPVAYGTEGAMHVTTLGGGRPCELQLIHRDRGIEIVEPDPLPAHMADIACAYVHHKDTGEPMHVTLQPDFNLAALAILDAGVRSANSGKAELVQSPTYQIG